MHRKQPSHQAFLDTMSLQTGNTFYELEDHFGKLVPRTRGQKQNQCRWTDEFSSLKSCTKHRFKVFSWSYYM